MNPWNECIKENDDVNTSVETFIKNKEKVLDKHAPYKKLTKKQMTNKDKPWITKDIANLIIIKNKLHKKYIKCIDPHKEDYLFNKFKEHRNRVSNALKASKKNYYTNFFNNNLYNIKNTWKGIKEIINVKSERKSVPISLEINNKIETNPIHVADHFNSFFTNIGKNLSS